LGERTHSNEQFRQYHFFQAEHVFKMFLI